MRHDLFWNLIDKNLSPREYILALFQATDETGVLTLPVRQTDGSILEFDEKLRCILRWDKEKCDELLAKFDRIFDGIQKIAPLDEALRNSPEEAMHLLSDKELYDIWRLYVKDFDAEGFDRKKIADIQMRSGEIDQARAIALEYSQGKRLKDYEKEYLISMLDEDLSFQEIAYLDSYTDACRKEAAQRLGESLHAYETVLFAQRVCRLLFLNAPTIVTCFEQGRFAEKFVLHECKAEIKKRKKNAKAE